MKRVTILMNGSRKDGKIIAVKDTDIEQLVQDVCDKFKLDPLDQVQFYTSSGALIDDVQAMKDDEVLFVATKNQSFIPPQANIHKGLSEWVTLNVGGKKFTTTRSTLIKHEPDSMLARMFSEDMGNGMIPTCVDDTGAFLIDRSPKYFEPIIGYLRHGQLILDEGVNIRGILEEARFFGIQTLVTVIEELVDKEEKCGERFMSLSRRDVINTLIGTTVDAALRFQGVNLAGSDLSKLDLRNINFKYAIFRGANLSGCNLSNCCLERADMSECNLDGAILHGVKMVCANLEGSSLRGINCEDPMSRATNMEGINLKGANLDGSQLPGVNLRVATLKNAFLSNCDLRRAVLAGADLENCDLSGSDLHEANLRGANLKDAAFELMMTPLHMAQAIGR